MILILFNTLGLNCGNFILFVATWITLVNIMGEITRFTYSFALFPSNLSHKKNLANTFPRSFLYCNIRGAFFSSNMAFSETQILVLDDVEFYTVLWLTQCFFLTALQAA